MPTALRVSMQGAQVSQHLRRRRLFQTAALSQHLRFHQPLQAAALREDPSEGGIAPGHQLVAPGHQLLAPCQELLQLALLLSVLARRPAAGHQVVQLALLLSALARRPAAMRRAAGRLQPVQRNRFRAIIP